MAVLRRPIALAAVFVACAGGTAQAASDLAINQVYGGGGNAGATYSHDFVEIVNRGAAPVTLNHSIQYSSAAGTGLFSGNGITVLSGTLQPGQRFLVGLAGNPAIGTPLPTPDATGTTNMAGGAGKVVLVDGPAGLTCNGASTPCDAAQTARIVDLVGYGNANFFEGAAAAPTLSVTLSALRDEDGCQDTDDNANDFAAAAPNPRNTTAAATPCSVGDAAPTVASTIPSNGATDVAPGAVLSVTFSEPVSAPGAFSLDCAGAQALTVTGGPTTFTLTPDAPLPASASCSLTVDAGLVSDQDAVDPPDTMEADVVVDFTVAAADPCVSPATPIGAVQGSGAATPLPGGSVTVQGIVVGDYEGAAPTLRGFYLQDAGDGDTATSDGIFVFNGSANSVDVGDEVRVSGTAAEFQDQTQIQGTLTIAKCSTGNTVTPVDVTLPVASATALENREGMLVRLPQELSVTEHFQLGRFGQVVVSSGGRQPEPTHLALPGAPALAISAANALNRIIVDDANNAQNADPIVFGRGGNPLSASNTLRGGDTITGAVGVLSYTWAGAAASGNAFRVRPPGALGGTAMFTAANLRPSSPPDAGSGTIRIAAANLLNYFNTFGTTACTFGVGGGVAECRGASNPTEFIRQSDKTVAELLGLDADVIGVIEIENDGYGATSALQDLVDRLNTASSPGTYAFIDADAAAGQLNALGTDAIKVGFVYRPGSVTPSGDAAVLNTGAFGLYTLSNGDVIGRNRPALAQTFSDNVTGAKVTAVVNHLKSKGSGCGDNVSPVGPDPDTGDGQGECNLTRLAAAQELASWLATDPTGSGDADQLVMGDLNAYRLEDPVRALNTAGFADLINAHIGLEGYSYAFDGEWGYLDHALGTASLAPQVTGVAEWHVNADEPAILDYNTEFKSAGQITSLYAPDEFRTSDHDPVVIGLDLDHAAPSADAGGPYAVNEGSTVTLNGTGSDPEGTSLGFVWDLDGNGTFETAGQSVPFTGVDGPDSVPVELQVTDAGGLTGTDSATVTVHNVAPSLGPLSGPAGTVGVGASVTIGGAFTDPGALDTHTATIDWGDGTVAPATVTESGGNGSVAGSHAYAAPATYTVGVTVVDKDGDSDSETRQVVVAGGTATAVTVDGTYASLAGAQPGRPTATGTATISSTARVNRGKLTGRVTLKVKVTGRGHDPFTFRSTSITALAGGGGTGTVEGLGTVNDAAGYSFRLTAVDGSPDQVRMRVWQTTSGTVVYDDVTPRPLTSGSVTVA